MRNIEQQILQKQQEIEKTKTEAEEHNAQSEKLEAKIENLDKSIIKNLDVLHNIDLNKNQIIEKLESEDDQQEILRLTRELKESIDFIKSDEQDKEFYVLDIASKFQRFEELKHENPEIAEQINNIGQEIDKLKLPALESNQDPKEIFNIDKEGALVSKDASSTYELILKHAPKRWEQKMQKKIEELKEKKITKKLAEFMEKIELPRKLSKGAAVGAMILMGAYVLGGCTNVEQVEEEHTEDQLTPEELENKKIDSQIEKNIFDSIKGVKYNPEIQSLAMRNDDLRLKFTDFNNLDENHTDQPTDSKLFKRIEKFEYTNRDDIDESVYSSYFEDADFQKFINRPESIAQKLKVKLDSNIDPEDLIRVVSATIAESIEYDRMHVVESRQRGYARDIGKIIKEKRGVCSDYAVLTEFLSDHLIKKYNVPNIKVENINLPKHEINIVFVVNQEGNISATFVDPTWIDTGKPNKFDFKKLNALDWHHHEIFSIQNAKDMIDIMRNLERKKVASNDYNFESALKSTFKQIYNKTEYSDKSGVFREIINLFPEKNYNKGRDIEVGALDNFVRYAINTELDNQNFEHALEICKIADEELPKGIYGNVKKTRLEVYKDKIPAEFRK